MLLFTVASIFLMLFSVFGLLFIGINYFIVVWLHSNVFLSIDIIAPFHALIFECLQTHLGISVGISLKQLGVRCRSV